MWKGLRFLGFHRFHVEEMEEKSLLRTLQKVVKGGQAVRIGVGKTGRGFYPRPIRFRFFKVPA